MVLCQTVHKVQEHLVLLEMLLLLVELPLTNQLVLKLQLHTNIGFSSKGDSATLKRSWWAFNVSSYASGYTISNLNLKFDPTTNTSTNFPIAVIKSTAQGNADTNLSQSDWDSLDFEYFIF
jgi:hypothetical protein